MSKYKMTEKIKLSQVREEDYTQLAVAMNKMLRTRPIKASLDLGELFVGRDYAVPITVIPYAKAVIDRQFSNPEISFGVRPHKDDRKKITTLARDGALRKEVVEEWIKGDYDEEKYLEGTNKDNRLLESLLMSFETQELLFDNLVIMDYDVRYNPQANELISDNIYSGRLKYQGLMKTFFNTLGDIVDFNDLSRIRIEDIIEENTTTMFECITTRTRSNYEISKALESDYTKSPFMRLLCGLGFRDIRLGVDRYKCKLSLCNIEGRKSDNLRFSTYRERD
jgi:hypothetical protein